MMRNIRNSQPKALLRAMGECHLLDVNNLCGFGVGGVGTAPPPSYVGEAHGTAASSVNVTPHASTQAGDLMIALWHFKDTDTTYSITWPGDFTQHSIVEVASGIGHSIVGIATKTATSSEGAKTFSWTGYNAAGVTIITTRPPAGYPTPTITQVGSSASVNDLTVNAPGITLPAPALVLGVAQAFSAFTWTPPSGFTEINDFTIASIGGLAVTSAYKQFTTAGATGDQTFTHSVSDDLIGFLMAVRS